MSNSSNYNKTTISVCFTQTQLRIHNTILFTWTWTGNDLHGITIHSKGIIDRARQEKYPFVADENAFLLKSPDGYTFFIRDGEPSGGNTYHLEGMNVKKTQFFIRILQILSEKSPSIAQILKKRSTTGITFWRWMWFRRPRPILYWAMVQIVLNWNFRN